MFCRSFARRSTPTIVLATLSLAAATFGAFAAPNLTDLQSFHGRVTGTAKAVIGSNPFLGKKSRMIVTIPAATAAKIKITASVNVSRGSVPINNELTFTGSGVFRGKELAPGVTEGTAFKGTYTAIPGKITFKGKFNVNSVKGTFSGTATKSLSGRLKVTYSIFIGKETDAAYAYTYVGK